MDPAIEVIGLTKSFGNGRALAGIDLTIGEGEMVALIGTSGSGKSTLLRHLAGFVAADRGMVRVLAETVQRDGRLARDVRRIRARIGFVFQQFNLVGRLPVITNVLCGQLHRTSIWRSIFMRFTDADRQQAIEALLSVGIEQKAWSRASTLSGGQQQRAAIARCLVQGARVILADEPIASLDPDSSRNVMEVLARLNRERRCTVLVSLHQVEYAKRYCPRTIALRHGAVVFDGPSEYLTTEFLAGIYGTDSLQDPPAAHRSPIRPDAGADVATDPVAWPSSPSFQPPAV